MKRIMTVGELIDTAERKLPGLDSGARIRFDFVYFHPRGLHSYRGDYAQVAFGYSNEGEAPLASVVIGELKSALGTDFTGYKGGEYTLTRDKTVWVANASEAGSTGIVDVKEDCGYIVLETAHLGW